MAADEDLTRVTDFDLWVDFNDVRQDGTVTTLRRFACHGYEPQVGDDIDVGDHDGNHSQATVTAIEGELVTVLLGPE